MEERLQKILSARGVTSRRNAEKLIQDGRVTVNGKTASLGDKADEKRDEILLDGTPIRAADAACYIMLNKPVGYVTTASDERGRKNVLELVKDVGCRVYPVGRLDINSEGLLLLTNDGEFANTVAHPSHEKEKRYRVTASGNPAGLELLSKPMIIDGFQIRPGKVERVEAGENSISFDIVIHEGRNRQIRKMCAQAGLRVLRLRRTAIGNVELGTLRPGCWRPLTEKELESFSKNA